MLVDRPGSDAHRFDHLRGFHFEEMIRPPCASSLCRRDSRLRGDGPGDLETLRPAEIATRHSMDTPRSRMDRVIAGSVIR